MKITHSPKIQSLILASALSIGLGFVSPASAQVIHSYIVDSNGKGLIDLGTLGGSTSYASGINDAGHIVGFVTPVPEPGSLVLFSVGLLGLGLAWRRKSTPLT